MHDLPRQNLLGKTSTENTKIICENCSKITIKTPEGTIAEMI